MSRVVVVASHPISLINFRGPLIETLCARGHEVHAAAPYTDDDEATLDRLRELGVTPHTIPLDRTAMNPLSDLRTLTSLMRVMRRIRPDASFGYTIKPVVYGLIAAKLTGVPHRFALITGLGYAFTGAATGRRRFAQRIARMLYRAALNRAKAVFFQNPDDEALFRRLRLLAPSTRTTIVNGSGVDTAHYAPQPLPDGPPSFLLIARLLGDKGVYEYIEAARAVRREHPHIEFHLVGSFDPNPNGISREEVDAWEKEGTIVWHGLLADVRPMIAETQVYVLPSYREGTPRTVLEAMSIGRPVITTDAPGCRETVLDGENGFLVPVKSSQALVEAMKRLLEQPDLIARMGARSREIAEEKYDVHKVNAAMVHEMCL